MFLRAPYELDLDPHSRIAKTHLRPHLLSGLCEVPTVSEMIFRTTALGIRFLSIVTAVKCRVVDT